jgi:hypothetical protein
MFVYLQDEAPRIGCGWRNIEIVSRGSKWVKVRYAPLTVKVKGCRRKRYPIYTINQKFPVHVWAIIERHAQEN